MTKLEKIEQDIVSLNPADVNALADWLAEYRAELWDKQIAADANAGRLDKLVEQSRKEIAEGRVRAL